MDSLIKEDSLEDSDKIDGCCGEILFTKNGYIIFSCFFCKGIYKGIGRYLTHVAEKHNLVLQLIALDCEPPSDIRETETDFVKSEEFFSEEEKEPFMDENAFSSVDEEDDDKSSIQTPITQLDDMPTVDNYVNELKKDVSACLDRNKKSPKNNDCKTPSDISAEGTLLKNKVPQKAVNEFRIPTDTRAVRKRILLNDTTIEEERKFKCPLCGAAFKDKYNMRGHVRRHSKEKRYQCPECPKKFYTGSEVNVHMRFHTGERKFLCSDCGRNFSTNGGLMRHIKRHKNQKDVECQLCDKKFFDSSRLKEHLLSHSSERPFICQTCNATFVRRKSLVNHQKLHENKREFKCILCGAGFNQKAGLFCHMKCTHKTTK